jgi:DNA-binding transcriptional LysR family regulator
VPAIVPMVAAGFGVSIVPASIRQIHAPGARYLDVAGEALRAPISLAYRRDDPSVAVRNFMAMARRYEGVTGTSRP